MKYAYQIAVAALIIVMSSVFACNSAKAADLTVAHYLAAEEVLKETRTFRQAVGAVGGVWGAYVGYSVAAAAGASPVGIVATTISGAVVYGAAMYGGSTVGVEIAVHQVSRDTKKKLADMGVKLDSMRQNLAGRITY